MQKATRYAIIIAIVLLVLLIAGFILAGIYGVLLNVWFCLSRASFLRESMVYC